MKHFRQLTLATLFIFSGISVSAKDYTIASPNGKNVVTIGKDLKILVKHNDKEIVSVKADFRASEFTGSKVGVYSLESPSLQALNSQFKGSKLFAEEIDAPFYRQKNLQISYRQMDLRFSNGIGLQVRAYDEGVAYRFYTTRKGETVVSDETADFCFPKDSRAWLAYSTNDEKPFAMAFQNYYHETPT